MRILDNHCLFGRWPKAPRDVSAGRLVAVLKDLGIERGVCVSLRGVFYDHETGNRETLAVCAQNPSLMPAATINPKHYHSRGSLPAELARQGFRMLRLFPAMQGWSSGAGVAMLAAGHVVVERIFKECAEAKLPIAFGVGKFPDLAGFAARLAPPGARVILSDVYYNELSESVEVMRRREEFLMELGHTCAPGSIEFLVRELGAERLVLGTNQPLENGRGAIEAIRLAEIGEPDRAAILGGNLSRLLGGI
jgi:predicted TIM-barrel fold metal-dependent hydrolase